MALITNLYTANDGWVSSPYRQSVAAFARPTESPAVAYTANDVISDSTSEARALVFPDCGVSGCVINAHLITEDRTAASYELFLFSVEPTNFVDNTALALTATDARHCIGSFQFGNECRRAMNAATIDLIPTGSRGIVTGLPMLPLALNFHSPSGSLFGLLVIRDGVTHVSAAKFNIALSIDNGSLR